MRKENGFIDRMLLRAELEGEPIPGQLIVEIIGSKRVLIENHMGIVCYKTDEISVKIPRGCLCIRGKSLLLAQITKQRLVISGTICSAEFV